MTDLPNRTHDLESRILTPEQVAEIRDGYADARGLVPVYFQDLCDSHEALREHGSELINENMKRSLEWEALVDQRTAERDALRSELERLKEQSK